MTWICVVGIELSARTQFVMLATELAILVLFSVVALAKVWGGDIHGSVDAVAVVAHPDQPGRRPRPSPRG